VTCELHEDCALPCRVCAALAVVILAAAGEAIREWEYGRQPRVRLEPEHRTNKSYKRVTERSRVERQQRLEGYTYASLARETRRSPEHVYQLIARGETATSIKDGSYRKVRGGSPDGPRKKVLAHLGGSPFTPKVKGSDRLHACGRDA
jgi:hypothetical protein